ncbi:uncharacterized protein PAC_13457 [Phialocephala subalpina]|uniref:Uncharacterized protein n=1 Tax=Phialocephala subalpina TaxID=576137 RepID=A0A1L7XET6_9HELO|nr:uncharacterized protein PAC_13457 [Phialocephala subalpina]
MAEQQKQTREVQFSLPMTIEEETKPFSEKDVEKPVDHLRRLPYGTFVTARRLRRRPSISGPEDTSSSRIFKAFAAALLIVGTLAICSFLIVFAILG